MFCFSRSVSAGRRSLRPPVLPRFLFALFVVRRTCAPRVGGADESPFAPAEASERSPYVGAPLIYVVTESDQPLSPSTR